MALTSQEQARLTELEAKFGDVIIPQDTPSEAVQSPVRGVTSSPTQGLTPEEEARLRELEAKYGGIQQGIPAPDPDPQITEQPLPPETDQSTIDPDPQAMAGFDEAIAREQEYLQGLSSKDRSEVEDLMSKVREKVEQGSYLDTVLERMFKPSNPEVEQIKVDEGFKKNDQGDHISYYATPEEEEQGLVTGGYGHLMTAAERKKYPAGTVIPQSVVDKWFVQDIRQAQEDVDAILAGNEVPEEVENILVNMAFNLGRTRLKGFKKMLKAVKEGDYETAADEMVDSKWYNQVGNRSVRLVERMKRLANNGAS